MGAPPSSTHVPWRCAYAYPQPVCRMCVQDCLTDYALLASDSTSRKYVKAFSWRGNRLMDCWLHRGDGGSWRAAEQETGVSQRSPWPYTSIRVMKCKVAAMPYQ